ncbi:MAG: hypothetical protein ACK4SA_05505 [Caldilinea sp.]
MSEPVQRFNLDTMSGVFPGTRTKVYQRIRLAPTADETNVTQWARLLWYEDPPSCVVELETHSAGGTTDASPQPAQVLTRIVEIDAASFAQRLTEALVAAGWRPVTCGACAFWHPLAARTPDGLSTGSCAWRGDARHSMADTSHQQLSAQSLLAPACAHWQPEGTQPIATPQIEDEAIAVIAPMPKRAEQESDERWTLVGQLRRWLRRQVTPSAASPTQTWDDRIVERSGVGAGTEPCFVCQGRIANLGALATGTPEGDKRTFSVWRCRACYTYYLNDWIDRWERTDSLETEERYYRLSPAEALEVLAVIDNVVHAEHPAQRHERTAQRDWILAFMGDRPPLSHQIRQGR